MGLDESDCKCSLDEPEPRPGGAGKVWAPDAVITGVSISGVSISMRGGARSVVGRIGMRANSMGASGVNVGRWTLSLNIASCGEVVWS